MRTHPPLRYFFRLRVGLVLGAGDFSGAGAGAGLLAPRLGLPVAAVSGGWADDSRDNCAASTATALLWRAAGFTGS